MIPLAKPLDVREQATLDALCADPTAAEVAVDWLLERGTTLADVLLLFAGNQEDAYRCCVCGGKYLRVAKSSTPATSACEKCHYGGPFWEDVKIKPFTTGLPKEVFWRWLKATEPERLTNVDGCYLTRWEWVDLVDYRVSDDGAWLVGQVGVIKGRFHTEVAAIRDMKRRCLSLFPEVSWSCMRTYTEPVYGGVVTQSGTVTAPDLISA